MRKFCLLVKLNVNQRLPRRLVALKTRLKLLNGRLSERLNSNLACLQPDPAILIFIAQLLLTFITLLLIFYG